MFGDTPRAIVDKRYYHEENIIENELITLPNSPRIVDTLAQSDCANYLDLLTKEEVIKWKAKIIEMFLRDTTEIDLNDRVFSNRILENFMKLSIEILILRFDGLFISIEYFHRQAKCWLQPWGSKTRMKIWRN